MIFDRAKLTPLISKYVTDVNEEISDDNLLYFFNLGHKSWTFNTKGKRSNKITIATVTYVLVNGHKLTEEKWIEAVEELIVINEEQELFKNLQQFLYDRSFVSQSEEDKYISVLALYACRIFDNERWLNNKEFQAYVGAYQISLL